MSFDARHPDAAGHAIDPAQLGLHVAAANLRPDLLHKVGETFAVALSRLQAQWTADATPTRWRSALAEVARLERLGVQIQEIAHVLAGEGHWVTERVDLAAAARQTANMWSAKAQLAGVQLSTPQGTFDVDINPAIVGQLLELGLEHALHIGQRVELRCSFEGSPPCPTLSLTIHRTHAHVANGAANDIDDLQWLLFATLARAGGLAPQRQTVGDQVVITVALAAGLETETLSAALLPATPVAVGCRVLLVDPQEVSRIQSRRLLHDVGMIVDAAASIEQARHGLDGAPNHHLPDVLLTGFAADDSACSEFIDTLRAMQPRLRVVELVDDDNAFAFSVPGSDLPARVGRHTLARTLVAAISQELAAA
ncbi:MAG: response regulator [Burkholderiales bacterium]